MKTAYQHCCGVNVGDQDRPWSPQIFCKPGLLKNVAKAMNQRRVAFKYLRGKLPRLSISKVKESVAYFLTHKYACCGTTEKSTMFRKGKKLVLGRP